MCDPLSSVSVTPAAAIPPGSAARRPTVLNAVYYPASLSTVPVVLKDKALLGAGNALVLGA